MMSPKQRELVTGTFQKVGVLCFIAIGLWTIFAIADNGTSYYWPWEMSPAEFSGRREFMGPNGEGVGPIWVTFFNVRRLAVDTAVSLCFKNALLFWPLLAVGVGAKWMQRFMLAGDTEGLEDDQS